MDTAVALVQSYLYMNGYFTVTEYPVLELLDSGEVRSVTDADMLAVRFPGVGVQVPHATHGSRLVCDPLLDVPEDRLDLVIGEVKEGRAEINAAARDPEVLHAVLHRFGHVDEETADEIVGQLLADGEAFHPDGPRVRLIAFGSRPPREGPVFYRWISLGHIARFMHETISARWKAAQAIQSKDPALSFLLLLEKALRGEES